MAPRQPGLPEVGSDDPSQIGVTGASRRLEEGETIRILYGAGPALARADRYAERDSRFWISVDGDGDGFAEVLENSPGLDILPGPAARASVIMPSTAETGARLRVHVSLLDPLGSSGPRFAGEVELASVPAWPGLPSRVVFAPDSGARRTLHVEAGPPGVYRVVARAELGARQQRNAAV